LAGWQKSHPLCFGGGTSGGGDRPGWPLPVPATDRAICRFDHCGNPPKHRGHKKKACPPEIRLAQEEEIQRLIASFQAQDLQGNAVAQLEVLVRTAVFKSANELVGWLLQQAADRADGAYQAKPGDVRKGRETLAVQGIFGRFPLQRDYYHHAGKHQGHYCTTPKP
jgi:hypothetical protein